MLLLIMIGQVLMLSLNGLLLMVVVVPKIQVVGLSGKLGLVTR